MGFLEPKSCCFCISTRNGSLTLGSLALTTSIISLLIGGCAMILHIFWDQITKDTIYEYEISYENLVLYVAIGTLIWGAFFMTISSLLIHGIRKDRPGLMLPYLCYSWFMITIEVIFGFYMIILSLSSLNSSIFFGVFRLIIQVVIETHYALVINAYRKQVKSILENHHQDLHEEFSIDNNGFKVKV